MRGLTVIVAAADRARFRTALTLAAAQAALGARARLFLDEAAVVLLAGDRESGDDISPEGTAELVETCLALGVAISLCQSGLAAAGLDLSTLDPRLEAGGMTSVLAALGDDRLVVI